MGFCFIFAPPLHHRFSELDIAEHCGLYFLPIINNNTNELYYSFFRKDLVRLFEYQVEVIAVKEVYRLTPKTFVIT